MKRLAIKYGFDDNTIEWTRLRCWQWGCIAPLLLALPTPCEGVCDLVRLIAATVLRLHCTRLITVAALPKRGRRAARPPGETRPAPVPYAYDFTEGCYDFVCHLTGWRHRAYRSLHTLRCSAQFLAPQERNQRDRHIADIVLAGDVDPDKLVDCLRSSAPVLHFEFALSPEASTGCSDYKESSTR